MAAKWRKELGVGSREAEDRGRRTEFSRKKAQEAHRAVGEMMADGRWQMGDRRWEKSWSVVLSP